MVGVRSNPPQTMPTDEYQRSLLISPSFKRVDDSVLELISQIFSSDDRRAINGFHFLAHFLRLAQIVQLSLFPDCDVAVISVQSVWMLCTSNTYAWPFSYEATSKYLRLLCALGLFSKPARRKSDPVTYHFPLRSYTAPESTSAALQSLRTSRNGKVRNALALKRLSSEEPKQNRSISTKIAASTNCELIQRLQMAAIAVRDALQKNGVMVPTTALQQITAALSHTLLSESRFLLDTKAVSFQAECASERGHRVESAIESLEAQLSSYENEPDETMESATCSQNLLSAQQKVDSVANSHTEFSISNNNLYLKETECITELNGSAQSESAINAKGKQKVDSLSEKDFLGAEHLCHDASELSYLFEHDDSSVGHYTTLLRENHHATRLAVIDAWMRSKWPDPGYKRKRLGGGWVTQEYKVYCSGTLPPAEFRAWAETDYSYRQIKMVLDAIDHYQQTTFRRSERPLPSEVIVAAEAIADSSFWEYVTAQDLERRGYLYVDVEGDLVSITKYKQLRLRVIDQLSQDVQDLEKGLTISPSCLLHGLEHMELEHLESLREAEVIAYLTWIQPQVCLPQKLSPSCQLPQELADDIGCLEAVLDPTDYQIGVYVIPLTRRPVIGVCCTYDRTQQWFMKKPGDVHAFLSACQSSMETKNREDDPHSTSSSEVRAERQEAKHQERDTRQAQADKVIDDLRVGLSTAQRDENGKLTAQLQQQFLEAYSTREAVYKATR